MAFIPPNAKWFLAEIVLEFNFEVHDNTVHDNTVHTNWILIRADSPDEAYAAAEKLGREAEMSYTNPDREAVTVRYRGLRDLNVIQGDLEHGTELTYEKRVGMSEAELERWVSKKTDLGVFQTDPTDADDGDEHNETENQGQ